MKKVVLSRSIRKVAVAVNLSNASWRDFLTGFFDYAKRKTHWDIRVVQSAAELERAAPGCHGLITGIAPTSRVLAICAKAATPLAVIGADWKLKRKGLSLAFIRNDNEGIGRFCAQHFQTLGKFAAASTQRKRGPSAVEEEGAQAPRRAASAPTIKQLWNRIG